MFAVCRAVGIGWRPEGAEGQGPGQVCQEGSANVVLLWALCCLSTHDPGPEAACAPVALKTGE